MDKKMVIKNQAMYDSKATKQIKGKTGNRQIENGGDLRSNKTGGEKAKGAL